MKLPLSWFTKKSLSVFVLVLGFNTVPVVDAASSLPNFSELVDSNAATIVEIKAVRMVQNRSFLSEQDLEEFLRRRLNPNEESPLQEDPDTPDLRPRGAVGSGFITSADGYVVTNHHVVEGAEEIIVELMDRREYTARIVGLDAPSDLALLKINASDLPFVEFGDSDSLRVGDWVLAIGSPFGLEFSAAAGIVSAKGRSVPGNSLSNYNYMSFIQSDVAINQGNSGGPLFNLAGEVIGINSQILSSTGGSNGISFSIPSNVALNVIAQLKDSGSVQRGLLGVQIKDVSFALAQSFDLDRPHGAFVDLVSPGSPADQAGIKVDDVILQFNDRNIEYSADLPFYVGQNRPGTEADVVLFRNGRMQTVSVTLGSSPLNEAVESVPETVTLRRNPLGLEVAELDREARQVAGVSGIRVTEVDNGPAQEAGIREGDVIVSLNRVDIDNVEQFDDIVARLPGNEFVPIRIVREGRGTTLALEMD